MTEQDVAKAPISRWARGAADILSRMNHFMTVGNSDEELWVYRRHKASTKSLKTTFDDAVLEHRVWSKTFPSIAEATWPFDIPTDEWEEISSELDDILERADQRWAELREQIKDQGRWDVFQRIRSKDIDIENLSWSFPKMKVEHP